MSGLLGGLGHLGLFNMETAEETYQRVAHGQAQLLGQQTMREAYHRQREKAQDNAPCPGTKRINAPNVIDVKCEVV